MRALFDVNALLAVFDRDHLHHSRVRMWWSTNKKNGWATCPLTQNGFIRVMSQPGYPKPRPLADAIEVLRLGVTRPEHEFWVDNLSIVDPNTIDETQLLGPRQITDVYLLALATRHGGRLVTFDKAIPITAVKGAKTDHLVVL